MAWSLGTGLHAKVFVGGCSKTLKSCHIPQHSRNVIVWDATCSFFGPGQNDLQFDGCRSRRVGLQAQRVMPIFGEDGVHEDSCLLVCVLAIETSYVIIYIYNIM